MNLTAEVKGAFAANISRLFHIPVAAVYTWEGEASRVDRAVVVGVVSGPCRHHPSDSRKITKKTLEVRIPRAMVFETKGSRTQMSARSGEQWGVHTSLVTLRIPKGL